MQNCRSWRKHLKLVCTKFQKEDMHSDSHLIFDRTQLSAAVEFLLCNCLILRLHTRNKPYETSNSLWTVLFKCNDPMLSNQNRCRRDKMQVFIFYDTSHKQKWQTFCRSQRLKSIANNRTDANLMIKQYTVFRYLQQLSQNIGSNTFIRIYSSHFAQENLQGKTQRTHTPYADSDVLQNFYQSRCLGDLSHIQLWIF